MAIRKKLQKIKIYIIIILILLPCFFIFMYLQIFFPWGAEISKGVNKKNISFISHPKMDRNSIIEILGKPLDIEIVENEYTDYRLIYARQGFLGIGGVSIYINIKHNKMSYMEMKDSWDYGFYMCNERKCPAYIEEKRYNNLIPSSKE